MAIVIVTVGSCQSAAALDRAHIDELNRHVREFRNKNDWKGAREALLRIGQALPAPTPYYLLRMASVETHLGHSAAAMKWMQRYADTGLAYDVATDDDLKPLLTAPGFKSIAAKMAKNRAPITKSEQVCSLPVADVMPEDITYDSSSGAFVVSSVQLHTLYRVQLPKGSQKECALQELPLAGAEKRWPTLAVSHDATRHALWMTSDAMPDFVGVPKEDYGRAALIALDARTGKTLRRFNLEGKAPGVLGDMLVADDGTVYVTDSIGGGVYRVHGDLQTAKLEKIADGLFSPQTPVLASDGVRLFVADYSVGIAVIDTTKGADQPIQYLPHPENIAVTGLDGFYRAGNFLIGIQNGTEPERIVRYRLNPAQTAILSAEVLEQGNGRLGDPTHAVLHDGWFYVSANVGWDKVDDHGQLKPGQSFTKPIILRFPTH